MPKGKGKSQNSVKSGKIKETKKTINKAKEENSQKTGAIKKSDPIRNRKKTQVAVSTDWKISSRSCSTSTAIDRMENSFKTMDLNANKNTILTKKGNILQVIARGDEIKCFCKNQNKNHNKSSCSSLPKQCPTIGPNNSNPENDMEAWLKNNEISLEQIMIEEKIKRRREKLKQKSSLVQPQPQLKTKPIEVVANSSLIEELSILFGLSPPCTKELYILKDINSCSSDYQTITNLFNKTMISYKMTSIKKVINPYLLLHYNFRKQSMTSCEELLLYHGTKIENIDSICAENFDWRLVSRHKYGWGVSFSCTPYYASHYSDQAGTTKAMFAVKVLVGLEWHGNCETKVPKMPFDTTTDHKEKVYVKYDDCCFYPAYVIYYTSK